MMDDRLGKYSSRDCQSLFLSHELNAFLTSAWTAKCSGCRSRYERMVCTIISAPLCMPMPNWLGRKKVLRQPLHLRRFTRPTVLVMELLMAMGRISPGWSFGTATCSCSCSYKGSYHHQKDAYPKASVYPGFNLMSVVTI